MPDNITTGFAVFIISILLLLVIMLIRERPTFRRVCVSLGRILKELVITVAMFAAFFGVLWLVGAFVNLLRRLLNV